MLIVSTEVAPIQNYLTQVVRAHYRKLASPQEK